MVELVVTTNYFKFDGELFLQLYGVAMGSKVSPTFACLFAGWLETVLLDMWAGRGQELPHLLRRFIDYLFFFWRGTVEDLEQFVAHMNSVHPTVKFKCERGVHYDPVARTVDFLDVTVWIDDHGYIQTTLYTKPCRVVQYLLTAAFLLSPWPHHQEHPLQSWVPSPETGE